MTLIVAASTGAHLQFLADTRITSRDVTQVEEIPGRLKIIALSPSLAVGYAGTSDHALDVIRRIVSSEALTFQEALPILRAASQDSDRQGSVDFLAATTDPTLSLTLVRNGVPTAVSGDAWIGDGDAAATFESRRASLVRRDGRDSEMRYLSATIEAFSSIVSEAVVPTVAGLQVRLGSTPDGFRYLEGAKMYLPSQKVPSNTWTALHFGGRPEGGFGYTFLAPREAGVSILAVHFFQGRLGFVYAPLLHDRPVQVPNVSHDELRAFVLERLVFMWTGFALVSCERPTAL